MNYLDSFVVPRKRVSSLLFFLLWLMLSFFVAWLAALPLACFGFACSNFAKKNKRLLAVYNMEFQIPKLRNWVKKILFHKEDLLEPLLRKHPCGLLLISHH